ncbi:MAG: long-chain fatty acid--CoA ligase, partial [Acidobacteriota bacterium]|nr:long-chain fatty acid--CoA ligase [Acidobacteriota bacterium]
MSKVTLPDRAVRHGARVALCAGDVSVTYAELYARAARTAAALLDGRRDLEEARIALLVGPGVEYAVL